VQALPVLSEAIRQVRFDRGLTLPELARQLDMTPRMLHAIEGDAVDLTTMDLLRIGAMAIPGPAKQAIVEELRVRFRDYPIVQVVA
jgi:transcriptional regulator with XRE-family HTH domain